MRDRLIELIADARNDYYVFSDEMHEKGMPVGESSEEYIADYLLENGVIVLQCKLGDTLFDISEFFDDTTNSPDIYRHKVEYINIYKKYQDKED